MEGQHIVSTRKLVDSLEEHELLEGLLERSKPPLPADCAGLHYLLSTPFRYPPLRYGSRFGTRAERSLWYGSVRPRTAFAETAYYRLLFLEGTTARLAPVSTELSLFDVRLRATRAVDLTRPPFDGLRATIASPGRYGPTQLLGREMRADGTVFFRYPSARDATGGVNVGVFAPGAFAARLPGTPEVWHCTTTRERVEMAKKDVFDRRTVSFARSEFEVGGQLPAPAP